MFDNQATEDAQRYAEETKRALDALAALASGRSTRLIDCVHREQGVTNLTKSLMAYYLPARDSIERHGGSVAWAPAVRQVIAEFDESVNVYEALLYCSLVCVISAYGDDARDGLPKATFASLVEFVKHSMWSVGDMELSGASEDGPHDANEDGGGSPAPAISPVPASARAFSCYDKLRFMSIYDSSWNEEELHYEEKMDFLGDYFERENGESVFITYTPKRLRSYLDDFSNAIESMVDAYLYDCGLSPACDVDAYSQVMSAIENAKRKSWAVQRDLAGRAFDSDANMGPA